jgi:CheY-like chemotaxis protein
MKKLLIVDDQASMVKILTDIFKRENFEIFTASNGQEGIDRAKETKPDLIIMDIMMPIKTGIEAIQELRAIPEFSQTKIFTLTAKGGTYDSDQAIAAGANGFLSKPFSPSGIVQEIKKAME